MKQRCIGKNFFHALSLLIFVNIPSTWCLADNTVIPITTAVPAQTAPETPGTPNLNAKGFILMDANTGKILAEKNADTRMSPASLTKLMTLYIISNAIKNGTIHPTDKVIISKKAWKTSGSRMFVKVGTEVPVNDLMNGIAIASGNDATVAMAEYLAGTEDVFANMMNNEAKNLGMNNSHFMDSSGLPDPNHYSTPHDLALLAQAIINHFPEDYRLYSQKWFTYNGIRQPNRNRLLWRYPYADGLKTGHTDDAGYCLVASASKNGMRLISVIMGEPNDEARTEDSIRLLTYGFRFYETRKLYSANTAVTQARTWKGAAPTVPLGVANDFYLTLPTGQYKNLETHIVLSDGMYAPIVKGKNYGTVSVELNNQVLATQPLIALANNDKAGFMHRLVDSIQYTFHKYFTKTNEKINTG